MPSPGELLSQRYRLDERVGAGAMGEVWRGTDTSLTRTVAVKVVRPELLVQPEFRERFLTEARTMAQIRHPGVVTVHDYHSGPEQAFLVMEYVSGKSLAQLLAESGRLDQIRAMRLIAQAAEALQAAHDTGVVHRDVKPGNLLVTDDDTVVLTDFGIARTAASAPLTATGALIGTMSYLAPEQVQGKPATPRSDVYALGVVAYECLTGVRPFQGDNPFEVALSRLRGPVPALPEEIAPAIRAAVTRALALDPEHRWPSAAEFGQAARQAVATAHGPEAAPSPDLPGPPAPGQLPPPTPALGPGQALPPPAPFPSPAPFPDPTLVADAPVAAATEASAAGGAAAPPAGGVSATPGPQDPYAPPPAGAPNPYAAPPVAAPGPYGPPPAAAPSPYGPPPAAPGIPAQPGAYPAGGYQVPPQPAYRRAGQPNSFGLIGMILGIVSIPMVVCCGPLGLIMGVAAVVLGVIGMRKAAQGVATNRGMALAGVICGAVGTVAAVGSVVLTLVSMASGSL